MVQDRPVTRRKLVLSAGTAASIAIAGCFGDDTPEDSPQTGPEDDSDAGDDADGSDEPEESGGSDDSEDAEEGNELQIVVMGNDESIEGARVTVDGEEDETDENGNVVFEGLEEGEYTVTAEADGFETAEEDVQVGERNLTIHSFELTPA